MIDSLPLTPLETAALKDFFVAKGLSSKHISNLLTGISVSEREYTGVGFFTDFNLSESLKIGKQDETYNWGDTQALINSTFEVGFWIFVESGQLTGMECYSSGFDDWPGSISDIEIQSYSQLVASGEIVVLRQTEGNDPARSTTEG